MLCSMTKLKGPNHLVALLQVPTPKDMSIPDGVLDTHSVSLPNCEPVMQPCQVMGFYSASQLGGSLGSAAEVSRLSVPSTIRSSASSRSGLLVLLFVGFRGSDMESSCDPLSGIYV
jgi:hypothetical protein